MARNYGYKTSDPDFSYRVSRGLGGNHRAGPLNNFPVNIQNRLDYNIYFNDFLFERDYGADDFGWVEDDVGVAVAATIDIGNNSAFGELVVDPGTADNTGIQAQFSAATGAARWIVPTNNKIFALGARLRSVDAQSTAVFVGLAQVDTTFMVAGGGIGSNNFIGLYSPAGTDHFRVFANSGNNGGASAFSRFTRPDDMTTDWDDEWIELAFKCNVGTDVTAAATAGTIEMWYRNNAVGSESSLGGVWKRDFAAEKVDQVGAVGGINDVNADGAGDSGITDLPMCLTVATGHPTASSPDTALLTIDYIWIASER